MARRAPARSWSASPRAPVPPELGRRRGASCSRPEPRAAGLPASPREFDRRILRQGGQGRHGAQPDVGARCSLSARPRLRAPRWPPGTPPQRQAPPALPSTRASWAASRRAPCREQAQVRPLRRRAGADQKARVLADPVLLPHEQPEAGTGREPTLELAESDEPRGARGGHRADRAATTEAAHLYPRTARRSHRQDLHPCSTRKHYPGDPHDRERAHTDERGERVSQRLQSGNGTGIGGAPPSGGALPAAPWSVPLPPLFGM